MENHRLVIGGRGQETVRRFAWEHILPTAQVRLKLVHVSKYLTLISPPSWSPDGAHITASNATNNQGLVFIAAVITRNTWTSEISLVGHENTVEVAVSVLFL